MRAIGKESNYHVCAQYLLCDCWRSVARCSRPARVLQVRLGTAFNPLRKRLQQPASVDDGRDENPFGFNAINNPIAVNKPLANYVIADFRNDASEFGVV